MSAAAIRSFDIQTRVSPAFGGRSFGAAGQYEVLFARIGGMLDPNAAENAIILDLDTGPVGDDGFVHYSTEVAILRPVDLALCSGTLIYEVLNRGNGMIDISGRSTEGALSMLDLFMDRGDIVVAAAWQADLARPVVEPVKDQMLVGTTYSGSTMYADLPHAFVNGEPVVRRIRQEHSVYDAVGERSASAVPLLYPAAPGTAVEVFSRRYEDDVAVAVDPAKVELRGDRTVSITANDGGQIYDVLYRATGAFVSGIGLAIPRDLIAWLRSTDSEPAAANPLQGEHGRSVVEHVCAYGISQSGRYLKEFLWRGFNQDVNGARVFDGAVIVVSGGKKGFFNGLFARPALIPGTQEGHRHLDLYPFAYPVLADPVSGKTDGILKRCIATGTCPKIIHIDTDTEVVEGFGWLLTTGPDGRDITQPDNLRLYSIAGSDHGRGGWRRGMTFCRAALASPVPVFPFVRSLMMAMRAWVVEGETPPPSWYPSLANGGLVTLAEAKMQWEAVASTPFDAVRNQPEAWVDGDPLPVSIGKYPLLTPHVDADGNTSVGIRHPMVAAPVGTLRGYTPRTEATAPQDLCPLQGEIIPFELTRDERIAKGDHRLSIEERYPDGTDDLLARRREVAEQLVKARLLLPKEAATAAEGNVREAWDAMLTP